MIETAVAVIVPTRDRPEMLRETLAALAAALRPEDEAVIVDSASSSSETAQVAEAAGFRVVRCDLPGISRARNAGLRATSAPIVAFTDDDCIPEPTWTRALARAFEDPTVAFATGRVVPDRVGAIATSIVVDEQPRRHRLGDDLMAIGSGANMAFRREALELVGEFDDALGTGASLPAAEDVDMFWRLMRRGSEGAYAPDAVVMHKQWRSTRRALRMHYRYGVGAGAFARKMARIDGAAGRDLLRELVWRRGVRGGMRHMLRGHRASAAAVVFMGAGASVGSMRARRMPLDGERFRA